MIAILIVCLAVLCLIYFKKKGRLFLTFFQRGILGVLAIAGLNKLFVYLAIDLFVGINVWTVLTSAILGFPGVCALYCINFF